MVLNCPIVPQCSTAVYRSAILVYHAQTLFSMSENPRAAVEIYLEKRGNTPRKYDSTCWGSGYFNYRFHEVGFRAGYVISNVLGLV